MRPSWPLFCNSDFLGQTSPGKTGGDTMRRTVRILGAGLWLWTGAVVAHAAGPDLDRRVEELARPYVERGWCASVFLGVIENGRQHTYGFGDAGHGKPDADTVYEVGSATKTMTGALVADLVRRGKLNPDA